jgi:cytochrome c oxidase cbb3-type subunit 1
MLVLLLVGHAAFLLNFIWIACPFNSRRTAPAEFRNPPDLELAKAPEGRA